LQQKIFESYKSNKFSNVGGDEWNKTRERSEFKYEWKKQQLRNKEDCAHVLLERWFNLDCHLRQGTTR
jgi:hypothetical protein